MFSDGTVGADTERAEASGVGVAASPVVETVGESLPVLQAVRQIRIIKARVPSVRG